MARRAAVVAILLMAACGGGSDDEPDASASSDEGASSGQADAADVCDDDVVDALDDFLNTSGVPDFEAADAALEVVATAEPDLVDPVEAITELTAVAAEALEDVDPDDADAVDAVLADVFGDADLDAVVNAQNDVAEFVDDECDTNLADDAGDG